MSEKKRYHYNTFYIPSLNNRKEFEIIDRESYPNYPNHDEENDVPEWFFYIDENDSHWEDMVVDRLNEQDAEIKKLKKEILWWKYKCGEDINGDK